LLSHFFDITFNGERFPRPFGILYADERPVYKEGMAYQKEGIRALKGRMPLKKYYPEKKPG
jgi:2-oxoglutarate ferredoxin oxidoreductase subunit beta